MHRPPLSAAVAALTVPLLALSLGAPPASAGSRPVEVVPDATMPVTPGTVVWGPCPQESWNRGGFRCGSLEVPLDHAEPTGRKITLALSRIRHTGPDDAYQGVMLVNPGGPGGSGLIWPVLSRGVPDGAAAGYDWVGFDPRGVGASRPAISCDPGYWTALGRPRYEPAGRAGLRAWYDRSAAYVKACSERNDPELLRHLTTVDVAKDMDLIRAALQQEKLNYYGLSYGTYLGQVYSTLFPHRVRRQVFEATVDPATAWHRSNLGQLPAYEYVLNRWFDWIAGHDATYHLGRTGRQVRAAYLRVREQLNRTPARGVAGPFSGNEWSDIFDDVALTEDYWAELATVFSGYVRTRDVAVLEEAYVPDDTDNFLAVMNAVQCTDAPTPAPRRWQRDVARAARTAPLLSWQLAWLNGPCLSWPVPARRPFRVDGRRAPATLMVNQTLDALTPYPGSLAVRERFPGARLVAIEGGMTHGGGLNLRCSSVVIARYLATGELPSRRPGRVADLSCPRPPLPEPAEVVRQGALRQHVDVATGGGTPDRSDPSVALNPPRRPGLRGAGACGSLCG